MTNSLARFFRHSTALSAVTFGTFLGTGLVLNSSTAWAVNECGTAVAGDTVICNNDGSPATDTSPYTLISYTLPVHLVVDGTNNPINILGAVTNTGNGNRSITMLGSVSITNPSLSGAVIGSSINPASDYSSHITLGEDVSVNVSRTNINGQLVALWSRSRNGANMINSQADIIVNQTGTGGTPYIGGVAIQDAVGGANASAEMNLSGLIDLTSSGNGTLLGASIFMLGAGSSTASVLNNNATVILHNNTGNAGCYGLSSENTGTGGSTLNHNGSLTISGTCGYVVNGIAGNSAGNVVLNINGTMDIQTDSLSSYGIISTVTGSGTGLININNNVSVVGSDSITVSIGSLHDYTINVANNVSVSATGTTQAVTINGSLGNNGIINIGQGAQIFSNLGTAIITGVGNDEITSSGIITGSIETGAGNDIVTLLGGSITGGIEMGDDDDTLNLTGITATNMALITHLDGGTGNDTLTFTDIQYKGASLASNDPALGINLGQDWETINFVNSQWTLTDNLSMGGSTINIDSTSTLYAGNGVNPIIASVILGDPVTLNNAGIIDLTNGTSGTTDTLTIMGHYVGQGGSIVMNTSPTSSDRIIVDGSNGGGSVSGTTLLNVRSTGLGEETTGNGILLVETINGATTSANAFALTNGSVGGGIYSYVLSGNANQNWYLVSAGLRPEIGLDMTLPAMTHQMGLGMLGTMNERVYFDNTETAPGQDHKHAIWARTFGEIGHIGSGANPAYDWTMSGIQTGADLYRDPSYESSRNIAGFYVGASRMNADVGSNIGDADITGYSAGLYWTHHARDNAWYTDAVIQGTLFDNIRTSSTAGEILKTKGQGFAASFEAGQMVYNFDGMTITPQAQMIYQSNDIDNGSDAAGSIAFENADAVYGRLGIKYAKDWDTEHGKVTGWLRPNIWHNFNAKSSTTFSNFAGTNAVTVKGDIGNTWGQIGAGVSAEVGPLTRLYASADYNAGLDNSGNSIAARGGVKIMW